MARGSADTPVVFFLIDQLHEWRGTETHLFRLLTALRPDRLTPVVGVLGEAGLAREFTEAGIRVHELGVYDVGSANGLLRGLRVGGVLRREGARLLVSYHTASDLLAPILASMAGIPTSRAAATRASPSAGVTSSCSGFSTVGWTA